MKANETELKKILEKYKEEQLPFWKFGIFVGYHAFAFTALVKYASWLRGPKVKSSTKSKSQFGLGAICLKGSKHAVFKIVFSYFCLLFMA